MMQIGKGLGSLSGDRYHAPARGTNLAQEAASDFTLPADRMHFSCFIGVPPVGRLRRSLVESTGVVVLPSRMDFHLPLLGGTLLLLCELLRDAGHYPSITLL